jgi:hypothetical protein
MRAFFVIVLVFLSAHNTVSTEYQNNDSTRSQNNYSITKIWNKNLNKIKNREKRIFFVKSNR